MFQPMTQSQMGLSGLAVLCTSFGIVAVREVRGEVK